MQISHLRSERDILRLLDHPLLVRMHGCCQDEQCVYFVMEYVPGVRALVVRCAVCGAGGAVAGQIAEGWGAAVPMGLVAGV